MHSEYLEIYIGCFVGCHLFVVSDQGGQLKVKLCDWLGGTCKLACPSHEKTKLYHPQKLPPPFSEPIHSIINWQHCNPDLKPVNDPFRALVVPSHQETKLYDPKKSLDSLNPSLPPLPISRCLTGMYTCMQAAITLVILEICYFKNTKHHEIGRRMLRRMRWTMTNQSAENLKDSCIHMMMILLHVILWSCKPYFLETVFVRFVKYFSQIMTGVFIGRGWVQG